MRVGINLFPLTPHAGGIGKFILSMVQAWPVEETGIELTLFTFRHHRHLPPETWGPQNTVKQLISPRLLGAAAKACDVYYCPFGRLIPSSPPCPSAFLVMDIQEFFYPEHFGRAERGRRMVAFNRSIRHANHVVAISDFCKQSMVEVLGINADPISVVPLCAPPPSDTPSKPAGLASAEERLLLYPAIDWPHKNHTRLFKALAMARLQNPDVRLVLTGARLAGDRLARQARQAGVHEWVTDLGHISTDELAWLYRRATALVFPSLFEGFGIPLVEAMQAGVPVVCSNSTSMPEVVGDAALAFNPQDTCSIARALHEVLQDEEGRQRRIQQGLIRASTFTMDRVIERHAEVFRRARDSAGQTVNEESPISWQDAWYGHVPADIHHRAVDLLTRGPN